MNHCRPENETGCHLCEVIPYLSNLSAYGIHGKVLDLIFDMILKEPTDATTQSI